MRHRSRGKGIILYPHVHTCTSVMLKHARSRLSTKITVASSGTGQSPSVIERFRGTRMYVRRVMAKKNGDTRSRSLPNIHHSTADSKVTKAISYSLCLIYRCLTLDPLCQRYGDIMFFERLSDIIDKIVVLCNFLR